MDDVGLVTIESRHPVAETLAHLEAALKSKGVTVFARIDHAAGPRPPACSSADGALHLRRRAPARPSCRAISARAWTCR